jgi:orotate phosphoribosyltransferase
MAGQDLEGARRTLLEALREHALVIGDVTLASGERTGYYVDAKRALLWPAAFRAAGELVAAEATERNATAVGGMTMGADPLACAAIAVPGGEGLVGFFVRKERKEHGLQRWIEGPELERGARCLVVEDVITTGRSTRETIAVAEARGARPVAVGAIIDRSGGRHGFAVPLVALTTLDLPTYPPDTCPLCAAGGTAEKPGSRPGR